MSSPNVLSWARTGVSANEFQSEPSNTTETPQQYILTVLTLQNLRDQDEELNWASGDSAQWGALLLRRPPGELRPSISR